MSDLAPPSEYGRKILRAPFANTRDFLICRAEEQLLRRFYAYSGTIYLPLGSSGPVMSPVMAGAAAANIGKLRF